MLFLSPLVTLTLTTASSPLSIAIPNSAVVDLAMTGYPVYTIRSNWSLLNCPWISAAAKV